MGFERKPYLQSVSIDPAAEIDWDAHPFSLPAVRSLDGLRFHADVTFFVGENGAGKSTVLEALALALGYSQGGGTRNARLELADDVSPLHRSLKLARSFAKPSDGYFLRAETFHSFASYITEVDPTGRGYGDKPLHTNSHGEAFMAVLLNKLRGNGLYLFDEPEAALSPNRQLAALRVIHQLVQAQSQLIIATHSPILLAYPNARILQFDSSGITEIAYEDTEHYAVTRDFLNHYPRRLEQLLADE